MKLKPPAGIYKIRFEETYSTIYIEENGEVYHWDLLCGIKAPYRSYKLGYYINYEDVDEIIAQADELKWKKLE